jgi:hypothetical protein
LVGTQLLYLGGGSSPNDRAPHSGSTRKEDGPTADGRRLKLAAIYLTGLPDIDIRSFIPVDNKHSRISYTILYVMISTHFKSCSKPTLSLVVPKSTTFCRPIHLIFGTEHIGCSDADQSGRKEIRPFRDRPPDQNSAGAYTASGKVERMMCTFDRSDISHKQ